MHALIDADRLAYCFGGLTDEEGYPQPWGIIEARVQYNLECMLRDVNAHTSTLYLTSDNRSNFRFDVASIRPYKGNRKSEKYFWYEQIRRFLIDEWKAIVVEGMEADDALGIAQLHVLYADPYDLAAGKYTKNLGWSIICSVDKDLDNIPGWHYNELKQEKYWVSATDALHNFYCQLLVGDAVDNIPGLYGVGKSSTLCKHVRTQYRELDMYTLVREQYEKRFGSYWKQFLWENGTLLWILRSKNTLELRERFEALELERLNKLNEQSFGSSELEVA